jgi:hypothetical protein
LDTFQKFWLLVQVHYHPQCDDGQIGGTKHGGVPRVVVEVSMPQSIHGDAAGVRWLWQHRCFVSPLIGKDPIFNFAYHCNLPNAHI